MAMDSKSSGDYSNLYITYKTEEKGAFESLFPMQKWREWSLTRLRAGTESVALLLTREQRESIINSFQRSIGARKDYSGFFGYVPPQSRLRHDRFVQLLGSLIDVLKAAALPKAEPPKEAVFQLTEALDNVSVDEAAFLCFLEDIELLVQQAVALWSRVAAGNLCLSTASMRTCCIPFVEIGHEGIPPSNTYLPTLVTSTVLCQIKPMVNAESLLNESLFGSEGLVAGYKNDSLPFWNELQSCAGRLEEFVAYIASPFVKSQLGRVYAPKVFELLNDGIERGQKNGSPTRFSAVVAASFIDRCKELSLDPIKLRASVTRRISDLTKLLKTLCHRCSSDENNFQQYLSLMPKFQTCANRSTNAVNFGVMVNWLEALLIHSRRFFIHESAVLQLFAYICESAKLRGRELPAALEALFDDSRVAPFLFLNGRPKTVDAISQGIERWSDPGPVSSANIRIFDGRDRPTLTKQITVGTGAVTRDMVQRLGEKTLEEYLEWERGLIDPIPLEDSVISAANSFIKKNSVIRDASSELEAKMDMNDAYADSWLYLRLRVLKDEKIQNKFLDAFIEQWAPGVREEGPEGSIAGN